MIISGFMHESLIPCMRHFGFETTEQQTASHAVISNHSFSFFVFFLLM